MNYKSFSSKKPAKSSSAVDTLATQFSKLKLVAPIRKAIHKPGKKQSRKFTKPPNTNRKVKSDSDLVKISESSEFYGVVLQRGPGRIVNFSRVTLFGDSADDLYVCFKIVLRALSVHDS